MKRRLLSLALALSMCLTLIPASAFAQIPQPLSAVSAEAETTSQQTADLSDTDSAVPSDPDSAVPPDPMEPESAAASDLDSPMLSDTAPTNISTIDELKAMKDGSYTLAGDIDLTGKSWTSINFSGTLDGAGHTITLDGAPLFDTIEAAGRVVNLVLEGSVEGKSLGSLAFINEGAIHNCYSGASVTRMQGDYFDIAGFTGSLKSGTISNCLAAGDLIADSFSISGISAKASGGKISNCYWTSSAELTCRPTMYSEACSKKTADEIKEAAFLTLLNSNLDSDGISWGLNDSGVPVPGGTGAGNAADKSTLAAEISKVEAMSQTGSHGVYTDASWSELQAALTNAKAVNDSEIASQTEIDAAADALTAAVDALELDLSGIVNRTALKAAIAGAEAKNSLYTDASWIPFASTLNAAKAADADITKTQEEIDSSVSDLTAAGGALVERTPEIVPLPADALAISDSDGLLAMESGKSYYLENDIVLPSDWKGVNLNSLLDGKGHTIALNGNAYYCEPVFKTIGSDAQVQNLGVIGSIKSYYAQGALAKVCSGSIINCYSKADVSYSGFGGSYAGGLAGDLKSGGAIVNSYAAGTLTGGDSAALGGLAGRTALNSAIRSSFWSNAVPSGVGSGECRMTDSAAKSPREFYDKNDVLASLNSGRGDGSAWNQNSDGYPWFGAEQEFIPPETTLFTLTADDGGIKTTENKGLLSLNLFDGDERGYVGKLSYSGDETAAWQIISGSSAYVTSFGRLEIKSAGTVIIGAFDPNEQEDHNWTYTKELARFTLSIKPAAAEDVRFTVTNAELKDGAYTVAGRQYMACKVDVRLTGEDEYRDATNFFNFTGSEYFSIYSNNATPKAPGEGWLKAASKSGAFTEAVSAQIKTNSTYVPVESITLKLDSDRYSLHSRQAATTEAPGALASPTAGSLQPITSPSNASYQDNWTITSSNPEVADYVVSMVYNIMPKKAGTTTITATLTDDGNKKQHTFKKEITFFYKNPIRSMEMSQTALSVKAGETIDLPLTFIGELEECGISMSDMEWAFEGAGSVQLSRNPIVVRGNSADGVSVWVANPQWSLTGVKTGTVKVTGTPVDQTNSIGSVVFSVDVTAGEDKPPADHKALVEQGISGAQKYISGLFENKDYTYGNEWEIFSLSRSGGSIASAKIDSYLKSADDKLAEFLADPKTKPTDLERVALALGALGQDVSAFKNKDVVSAILNSDLIGDGSNESIFALLVIDSKAYAIPDGAKWTREALVDEIIDKYQNADGGFGLTDNLSSGVDMTAMALQALAPYTSRGKVSSAIDKGLDYLRGKQQLNGGFGSVESAAQVLTALSALGIDPLDEANGFVQLSNDLITNIMTYYDEESGGFSHSSGEDAVPENMSSVQALYSLEAYRRFQSGGSRLYDFSDANLDSRTALTKRIAAAEKLTASDYTADSWKPFAQALTDAKAVLASESASDDDLSAADLALANAIAGLKKAPSSGGDSGSSKLAVTFRLIGATLSEESVDMKKGTGDSEYKTWIKTKKYTMEKGDTVYDLFTEALDDAGLDSKGADSNYVRTITAPDGYGAYDLSEFTNGKYSGWMYTIDGTHPDVGLKARRLKDGDTVVWHYVNDYRYEVEDWGGGGSLGDKSTWNKWLDAADSNPPSGNGSGSGSGSGSTGGSGTGGSGGQDKEVATEIKPSVSADKTGAASAKITAKEADTALQQAKKDKANVIVIEPQIKGDAAKISVTLPASSAADIAKEKGLSLAVRTPAGNVTIPNSALSSVSLQASGSDLTFTLEKQTEADLKAVGIEDSKAAAVKAAITAGGKSITSFGGKSITVGIPAGTAYTAGASYKVLVISADGTKETASAKIVSRNKKNYAEVSTEHFSTFILLNEKTSVTLPFSDVKESDWFFDAVGYVYQKGMMAGASASAFEPYAATTRGMIVTILYQLENKPAVSGTPFSDVASGQYYANAAAWAEKNGIVSGYGSGAFGPNDAITREQLATILMKYAKLKGYDVSARGDLSKFSDKNSASSYAADALSWANAAGLISGNGNGLLDPRGKAERSQAASILMNFCENAAKKK